MYCVVLQGWGCVPWVCWHCWCPGTGNRNTGLWNWAFRRETSGLALVVWQLPDAGVERHEACQKCSEEVVMGLSCGQFITIGWLVDHGGPRERITLCHDFFWTRASPWKMVKWPSQLQIENRPIKLHVMCQDLLGHQSREQPCIHLDPFGINKLVNPSHSIQYDLHAASQYCFHCLFVWVCLIMPNGFIVPKGPLKDSKNPPCFVWCCMCEVLHLISFNCPLHLAASSHDFRNTLGILGLTRDRFQGDRALTNSSSAFAKLVPLVCLGHIVT